MGRSDPPQLGPICSRLVRELEKLLGVENVKVYGGPRDCTIDTRRLDVIVAMREKGKSRWIGSYGSGSIWINEETGRMEAGDFVTLLEKERGKLDEIRGYGCLIEEIHRYPEFGVVHIHATCDIKDAKRFAKLVAE